MIDCRDGCELVNNHVSTILASGLSRSVLAA